MRRLHRDCASEHIRKSSAWGVTHGSWMEISSLHLYVISGSPIPPENARLVLPSVLLPWSWLKVSKWLSIEQWQSCAIICK